jgi:hypothetical protein
LFTAGDTVLFTVGDTVLFTAEDSVLFTAGDTLVYSWRHCFAYSWRHFCLQLETLFCLQLETLFCLQLETLYCLQLETLLFTAGDTVLFNFHYSFVYIVNIYREPSWPWSYGSWIYNYLCNQCLSPLTLWVWISIRARCTTLCIKVCQWLATGRWFSSGPPVSSTNKTDRHDIAEI